MAPTRALAALLASSLCAACGRAAPDGLLCCGCARRLEDLEPLAGPGPAGVDRLWASAAHQGVARELVVAMKFRRLLPVAGLLAERIARLAPATVLSGAIVPAPSAPLRAFARGFDPAVEIAAALSRRTGLQTVDCLRRSGTARQVGRPRAERLGRPPRLRVSGAAPASVVLVDDVVTTGATIASCAAALRAAGARRVVAVAFSRRP